MSAELLRVCAQLAATDERAAELRRERGRLIRELIKSHGWKFVGRTLGVGRSRVYAMREQSPRDAERRGTGCQPNTPPPATPKEQAWQKQV